MLELREMYRGVAVHATADEEHLAALELLLLVMLADGRISADEQDAIEELSDELDWDSPSLPFSTAFGRAMATVREARVAPDGIERLLDSIDDRIASRVLRAELLGACRDVADSDHERSPEESELLAVIEQRFRPAG
ncbi:MAG: TerB family tellurite resistance protein [Ilumatobacteraceae bacterium]